MVLYDTTNKDSYELVKTWMPIISRCSKKSHICTSILGTKCDLLSSRAVSYDQGKELADSFHTKFLEISTKASFNLDLAFSMLLNDVQHSKQCMHSRSLKYLGMHFM